MTLPHRSRLLAFLLGLLVLPACGEPADAPGSASLDQLVTQLQRLWTTEEEEARTRVLQQIGELARKDPETVIPKLIEGLKSERVDPRFGFIELELDYTDSKLDRAAQKADAKRNRDVIYARLEEHGRAMDVQGDFKNVGQDQIARIKLRVVRNLSDTEDKELVDLLDIVTRAGRLDLAVVVERPGEERGEAKSLWTASAEEYDAFLAKHTAALTQAIEAGDYHPRGESPLEVVWQPPAEPGGPVRSLLVLRSTEVGGRFTHEDIAVDGKLDTATQKLVLALAVKPERHEALDAWCATHQGRSLALLVDYRTELVFPMPRDAAQLHYTAVGRNGERGAERFLKRFVSAIRPGALSRPVEGRLASSDPTGLETPLSMALVAAGPAAREPLEAVLRDDEVLARRARWIRREIDRLERESAE